MRIPAALTLVILAAASNSAQSSEVYWTPAHELAPVDILPYPAAGDLDGDGDYDLSTHLSHDQYWNTGTPQTPDWELDTTMFGDLPGQEPIGTYGDVDSDGDLDLMLACGGDRLRFCWNIGTPGEPLWLEDASVLSITWGLPTHTCLDFGDLDADQDLDLLLVWWSGALRLLENTGTTEEPEWIDGGWIAGIQLGGICPSGALGDIDADGDLDFVGIDADRPVRCWENIGSAHSHEFVENPAMLTGVDEPSNGGWGVELFDIDADTDLDLLIVPWEDGGLLYLNESPVPVEPSSWSAIKAMFR